jgi:hypothetical protein
LKKCARKLGTTKKKISSDSRASSVRRVDHLIALLQIRDVL